MISSLFLRTIRHTPARQLVHRAMLMTKRRALSALAGKIPALKKPPRKKAPPLAGDLPAPFLSGAHGSVSEKNGQYTFNFLNTPRRFTLPVDWHREDLNTGTRLWKLNLHYFDYVHQLGNAEFEALVSDWITHNRPFTPGYWLDSWNSYAMSIRLVAWMGEYQRRQENLDRAFAARMAASIAEQTRFLQANLEEDIGGNHLIKNIRALYWCGRFFAGETGRKATRTANKLLARELDQQILPDGFHFELSPAYHCQVVADLLDCWRLMAPGGLRAKLEGKLAPMAQVASNFTHPDGLISLFNDGGLHMAVSCSALKDAYETLLGPWPQALPASQYRTAGFFLKRTFDLFLAYDAGRLGPDGLPAHAHGDIFSFELSLEKQRIIVDTGVFEYNAGARRVHSRATAAHNTLTLDDQDQGEFWSAFRLGRRPSVTVNSICIASGNWMVDAQHDGYAHLDGSPVHRRIVTINDDGVIKVLDRISGGRGQRAVSRLLLHPLVEIDHRHCGNILLRSGPAQLRLDAGAARVSVQDRPWWPDFGCEIMTRQLVLDYGIAPGEWSFQLHLENPHSRGSA